MHYPVRVKKMIQIRDVPEDVHRALRVRAAEAGLSLAEYLRQELERLATQRSVAEVLGDWSGERADLSRDDILEAVHEGRR
jgi:plasmid stability protein